MLEIANLSKTYRKGLVTIAPLRDICLSVQVGEFVAVHGPSGCGKTTLLLIAGGLLHPDAGAVRVAGKELYQMSPESRASFRAANIGFVFQQFHLISYLTVLDNVLTAAMAIPVPDAQRRAIEILHHVGLDQRRNHLPAELSTGERQRTALARALLHRPKLLLADEPTGNLDEENGMVVREYLAEHARGGGAVLLVTHDQRAAAYADRVFPLVGNSQGQLEKVT
jgi:ABC-type lipoprotein export system ATPase subunit